MWSAGCHLHEIMGTILQMKIFSIIHTFLVCFLPSDMPQLSSAKSMRDSRGQNDDNSIINHAYYGYITTLYGRREREGGVPMALNTKMYVMSGILFPHPPCVRGFHRFWIIRVLYGYLKTDKLVSFFDCCGYKTMKYNHFCYIWCWFLLL